MRHLVGGWTLAYGRALCRRCSPCAVRLRFPRIGRKRGLTIRGGNASVRGRLHEFGRCCSNRFAALLDARQQLRLRVARKRAQCFEKPHLEAADRQPKVIGADDILKKSQQEDRKSVV